MHRFPATTYKGWEGVGETRQNRKKWQYKFYCSTDNALPMSSDELLIGSSSSPVSRGYKWITHPLCSLIKHATVLLPAFCAAHDPLTFKRSSSFSAAFVCCGGFAIFSRGFKVFSLGLKSIVLFVELYRSFIWSFVCHGFL